MDEPNIISKFYHPDWDVTFAVCAYRKITKVEGAKAIEAFLIRNNRRPPRRGAMVTIYSRLR